MISHEPMYNGKINSSILQTPKYQEHLAAIGRDSCYLAREALGTG